MDFETLILKDMPDELNDLEKARYIYLKLAFYLSFSTKYNNTNDSEYNKMYLNSTKDISNFNENQIICKKWAYIYSSLLNKLGINNEIIDSHHQYVVFNYNNKLWIADATYGTYTDLARIRYGDHTDHFGVCSSQNIKKPLNTVYPFDEDNMLLDEIDKKFDFYSERKMYLENLKEDTHFLKEQGVSTLEKLEKLFQIFGTLNTGYYESKDFVRNMEYSVFSKEEMDKIHTVELRRTNKNLEVDIVQCIYIEENGKYNYFILAPNNPIVKVDEFEIVKLAALGYGIGDKKIPGVDYPKKFTLGVPQNKSIRYKINKNFVPSKIISYDKPQFGQLI